MLVSLTLFMSTCPFSAAKQESLKWSNVIIKMQIVWLIVPWLILLPLTFIMQHWDIPGWVCVCVCVFLIWVRGRSFQMSHSYFTADTQPSPAAWIKNSLRLSRSKQQTNMNVSWLKLLFLFCRQQPAKAVGTCTWTHRRAPPVPLLGSPEAVFASGRSSSPYVRFSCECFCSATPEPGTETGNSSSLRPHRDAERPTHSQRSGLFPK